MRRVETEGDSQSNRGRRRSEVRSAMDLKSRLRRLALERLESRTLLSTTKSLVSTLPTPVSLSQSIVGDGFGSTSSAANSSSPSVAVDPLNPQKLVAAWTTYDPGNKLDGSSGQVTTYVQGAYSIDGGVTWTELSGDEDADVQLDFSQAPVTSGRQPDFAQTQNATVAFGRDESAYLLSSTSSGGGGVLNLQKWDFTSQTPVADTFATPAYDGLSGTFLGQPTTVNAIYRWIGGDAALTPTLAVDNNLPTFTDGTTTQTDRYAGNVYVAWETVDAAPKNTTPVTDFNPNIIKLMSSSNGGQNFTYQAYLDGHGTGNIYDQPKLAISQGSSSVPGGQVTIVYDNAGPGGNPGAVAPFFDIVQTKADTTGGQGENFDSGRNILLNASTQIGTSGVDTIAQTSVPITVNITDTNFSTLANLTATISLSHPNLADTSATLTSPTIQGVPGTTVVLWNNGTDNTGAATNAPGALTGANLGQSTLTPYIGAVLDSTAFRSLSGDGAAPYADHFRPFGNLQSNFAGKTAAQLNGTWHLTITEYRAETITPPTPTPFLIGASLGFTSGLKDGTTSLVNSAGGSIGVSYLNSGLQPYTGAIQGVPVHANPSIASDNTLGSNSTYQGRLYVTLTDDNFNDTTGAYTTSTFIELYYSDDGGQNWNYDGIVNDDNGLTDGFSTGGYAEPGSVVLGSTAPLASDANPGVVFYGDLEANVRPKIDPSVAVDPVTGTVVVSYLDTRNDAAASRVATYIAASTDGGASFAPETFANPTSNVNDSPVVNAITGNAVNLGPIPDNESSGSNNRETTFGFGQSQGLAVENGKIIPVWSSNENNGSAQLNIKQSLFIASGVLSYAAGPRVLSSTQGPVGEAGDTVNTTRAADGSPIANTIVINFDRAVDPSTFPADGSTIGSSPLQVFYNNPGGAAVAAPIPLRVLSVTPNDTDTSYTIVFDPAGHGVGTYSYTLRPLVRGMIPYVSQFVQQVPFIDSNANSGQTSFTVTGHSTSVLKTATLLGQVDIYNKGTSTGSPNDIQIYLIAQDSTQYLLYSGTTQGRAADTAYSVSSSITIPSTPAELLDQTYTIKIVDNVPGEKVYLYNSQNPEDFNFQVQLTQAVLTGNLLDQNGNGVGGETTADAYSVPNSRNSLPLIVPGPHVVSTSVTGVNGVVSTGSDNLVNNDNANKLNVTFDRNMQVSSFTPSQILSITGPTGRIDGPQTFVSTGTSKTYPFVGSYQPIPKAGTLTSTITISNTGSKVSSLSVLVNITDPNDQNLQLVLVAPDGTSIQLVANNTASGANFTNTVFSDTPPANGRTATIPGSAAPYSLTYQPAQSLGQAFAGRLLDGNWQLKVTDSSSTGAQGRLNGWSLNVTPLVPLGVNTHLASTLSIPLYPDNSFKIAHLAVQLNISSTKDSDLTVYLFAPNQTFIPLIMNAGGNGTNFTNTVIDDNATIPIASGAAPFNLSYKPTSALSAFNGLSINGTWQLVIVNPNNDGSVTTLNSWSLIATPQLTVTPVNPVNGGARTFTVGFPTQTLSGNYNITLSPNILSVTANPANPSTGAALDTNLNAGVDALRGTSGGPTTPQQYVATSVPVAIPYASNLASGAVNGVLNSQINVPDNFPIQGDNGTVAGLTVTLNIVYYYDPDLSVTLKAPNGKTVTLFMNVGKGGSTANFSNTTFSDTTTPPSPIGSAGAPFFGTFNPQVPLSNFTTDLLGNLAFTKGLWTLTITNVGKDPGATIDAQYPPALLSWSLNFQKPQTNTGLGEAVADQKTVGFRLFNLAPTDPLANDTWTAVGPAGTTTVGNSINGSPDGINLGGAVSSVALDPSDPSGNTAYVGAASGGVWKTTNFLTTDASGPTYIPLTDFGSNDSINIGGIAIFPQNGDPNQSIVFAGTGNGQATTANDPSSVPGVGILRSTNGGASFTLLDSSTNVDASGNPLPVNSPLRDHVFVGTTTYKIVVDPHPLPGGGQIVYAALGGIHGGLWRSLDGGNHWTNLSAGVVPQVNGQNAAATDVILDQNSISPSTGNLDILYAAFQGVGVFISSNRGQALQLLSGTVGATNLIQNSLTAPGSPLKVNDSNTPNGAYGRIVLAQPALTNDAAQNILYQDWIYAAVENADGTFRGLYITKDRGENWTLARLSSEPTTGLSITEALPTNDNTQTNNYDFTAGKTIATHNGNSAFSLAIDPSNPEIAYLGGTQDYQTSGLIRVDLTGLYDAHAYVPFANDRNDGGKLTEDSLGRTDVTALANGLPYYEGTNPLDPTQQTGLFYTNLRHNPTNPFDTSATLFVYNSSNFTNDGSGVKWTPLDQANGSLLGSYGDPLGGSTNVHQLISTVDPLTGLTRLIIANDQGVFTGVFNADGTIDEAGIGTSATINGSRNGNLQDEQLYYSAAQPSTLAAQAAGALFYGSGIGIAEVQSSANLLSTGNLTWTVQGTAYGDVQGILGTNDRGGTGIATDQTGGVSSSNPGGNPALYEYDVPLLGGDSTNFFRVQNNGQTTGLVNNYLVEFPGNNILGNGNGVSQLGNFAVNPINGSQVLISSNLGNLYETTNKGVQWLQIGSGTGSFDGSYAPAVAYGAPDPSAPNGIGNLNNFVYEGTVNGHIYVTQTGAGPWTNISNGLDGSSVVSIFTNPNRGSHEAYAITLKGVYYMANSIASSSNPTPTWVNITGNLTQIQHNPNGNPALSENALLPYANGQLGGFRSIVADYRYAIPDAVVSTTMYPVLYVAGYGGVFRSLDNGQTWTAFPSVSFDSAPVDGGYLPNVDVTSLELNLGAINPATGHATQVSGDPEVLLASTLGRGDFAIRLAPVVFPSTIHLDTTLPAPGGSDSGVSNSDRVTNVGMPYIDGTSEISNFGNTVTITFIDQANGDILATGTTDAFGRFSIRIGTYLNSNTTFNDPSFLLDGTKNVLVEATDSSLATGNSTTFTYTLKRALPPTLVAPVLEATSDSGRFNNDRLTNILNPTFDIATTEPNTTTVELFRYNQNDGLYDILVGSAAAGVSPVRITDNEFAAFVGSNRVYTNLEYEAVQVDQAGNVSVPSAILTIAVKNILPPTLGAPTLDPSSNTGLVPSQNITNARNPLFDITGLQAGDQVSLYRSNNGSSPMLVGTAAVGANQVRDTTGVTTDGTYVYYVGQVDIYGNVSILSQGTAVTINTKTPAIPTLVLFPADDSGAPSNPDVTNIRAPRFVGVGTPGLGISILAVYSSNYSQGVQIATTVVAADGTYLAQTSFPLADNVYTLVARTANAAGNISYSAPLVVTIKGNGPQLLPTLSIFGADDTGVKGDGVTANRRPRFVGTTDKGVTVTLYALVNGVLSSPQGSTTSSTVNGSFQLQLPFTLTNGSTQLVAQATDVAGNKGPLSPVLNLRIITVTGDYANSGAAQFSVFRPTNETYYVRNLGSLQVDVTPGRDIPVQYDYNGDGKVDFTAYRFNTAEYYGFLSNGAVTDFAFGSGNISLPVSGYYDSTGVFDYGLYNSNTSTWAINLPRPGGEVVRFGTANSDIPVSAAYDGGGITEIATFSPGSDAFNVLSSNFVNNYQVSFTDPTVAAKGFLYKTGDIPAPADYDGIGKDEFAIYRPTTGQFFILKVPNLFDKNTWTLRTVSMNLPGGPRVGDEPASLDYEGTGKASPTVYRPSNSTFYEIQTTTGIQQTIPFGQPGLDVASAGPVIYRLSALFGAYTPPAGSPGAPGSGPSGVTNVIGAGSGTVRAAAISTSATTTTSTSTATSGSTSGSTIVLSMPTPVVTTVPPVVVPTSTVTPPSGSTRTSVATVGTQAANHPVTIGAATPKTTVKSQVGPKANTHATSTKKTTHPVTTVLTTKATVKPIKVETPTHLTRSKPQADQHHAAVAAALKTLGPIRKGHKED